MSASAWAQACSAQQKRAQESLEQSSYGSNAFTVRTLSSRYQRFAMRAKLISFLLFATH